MRSHLVDLIMNLGGSGGILLIGVEELLAHGPVIRILEKYVCHPSH